MGESSLGSIPVTTDPAEHARLAAAFEGSDIEDLEAYAADLGVTPPDDRDGWQLTYLWGPDGEDFGLHWYQAEDEPLARLEY